MRILFILDSVENSTSANVLMAQRLAGVLCAAGHTVHLLELWDGLHPQPELPGCTVHRLAFADECLMNAALENGRSGGSPIPVRLARLCCHPTAVAAAFRQLVLHAPRRVVDTRRELEKLTTAELYALLMQKCPQSDVEPNNRNRVMRVLEKLHDGDDAVPTKHPRYDCLRLGVTWPREVLGRRIDERMTRRFQEGMIQEVRSLMESGVSEEFLLKLGLEYKLITQYLTGAIPTEEELNRLLATAIKQFAKRQMTWFRRDGAIHWLQMDQQPVEEACALITDFLAK